LAAELVAKLRADGLSLRDIAEVLGISYQRVAQVAHGKADQGVRVTVEHATY
jgi:transcriptional regulator with XRE-family HTH domain